MHPAQQRWAWSYLTHQALNFSELDAAAFGAGVNEQTLSAQGKAFGRPVPDCHRRCRMKAKAETRKKPRDLEMEAESRPGKSLSG